LKFATKPHGHSYSHLLTCDLVGIGEIDIVDLVKYPNLIVKWAGGRFQRRREAAKAFCQETNRKALLWKTEATQEDQTWTELCLLTDYIPDTVLITEVEKLAV